MTKRIGIIGGMSYHSILQYYEGINRIVNERSGGMTSADLVIRSVNFQQYHEWMQEGKWDQIEKSLCTEAWKLAYEAKCNYVTIATNTLHKVAEYVEDMLSPPNYNRGEVRFVHIGDCVARKCLRAGVKRVALLGTEFVMSERFMKYRLEQNVIDLDVVDNFTEDEIKVINGIIFGELCHGEVSDEAVNAFLDIIYRANRRDVEDGNDGLDGVILGCTELNMLVPKEHIIVKPEYQGHFQFIDSTEAHIEKLAELCLSD